MYKFKILFELIYPLKLESSSSKQFRSLLFRTKNIIFAILIFHLNFFKFELWLFEHCNFEHCQQFQFSLSHRQGNWILTHELRYSNFNLHKRGRCWDFYFFSKRLKMFMTSFFCFGSKESFYLISLKLEKTQVFLNCGTIIAIKLAIFWY